MQPGSLDYYRQNFHALVTFAFVLLILNFVALGVIFYLYFEAPDPHYFITTRNGLVHEIFPLR